MKQNSFLIAAISLGIASSSSAAIVIANSAAASFPGSNATTPANMIDGKLAVDSASFTAGTYTTLTGANKTALVSNASYSFVGAAGGQFLADNANGGTITFTFTNQTIGEVLLWNYSQSSDRGIDSITMVEVMTDGVNWVNQSLSLPLLNAGDALFKSQSLSLGSDITGIDGIRLTLAQALTGPGETAGGFDEVAFSNAIPEPSSALLGGLGLLALLRRRRA